MPLAKGFRPNFASGDSVSQGSEFGFAIEAEEGWYLQPPAKRWNRLEEIWGPERLGFEFSSWASRQSQRIDGKTCLPSYLVSAWSTAHPGECELIAWDVSAVETFRNEAAGCPIPPPIHQDYWWDVDVACPHDVRVLLFEDPRGQEALRRARAFSARQRSQRPRPDQGQPSRKPKGPPAKPQPRKKEPKPAPKRELQPVGEAPRPKSLALLETSASKTSKI